MSDLNQKIISLLIVDDHHLIRDGIKTMLKSYESMFRFLITEADSGEMAIQKFRSKVFDIVLIDYQLPGITGSETIVEIKKNCSHAKFIALSNYDEIGLINKMIYAGASGYILKNIEPNQLIHAIKCVLEKKNYYSSEVAIKLLESESLVKVNSFIEKNSLTKREIEVLKLIVDGLTNDEIAQKLYISKRTVDTHRQNLLHKFRVKNTVGLVKIALDMNINNY